MALTFAAAASAANARHVGASIVDTSSLLCHLQHTITDGWMVMLTSIGVRSHSCKYVSKAVLILQAPQGGSRGRAGCSLTQPTKSNTSKSGVSTLQIHPPSSSAVRSRCTESWASTPGHSMNAVRPGVAAASAT